MCTSPTFMLCTLVCFAALKFKCIFFYFAPFLPLLSSCFVCLSYFPSSSMLPNSLFVYVPFTPFILLPFLLNFPPTYLLFPFYYYCDNLSTFVPLFFFIPSLHMLGIPIVTSSLFLPWGSLLYSFTHGFIVTFTFNHPHPLSVPVLLLRLKIWILNGNSSIVLTETSLKSWAD